MTAAPHRSTDRTAAAWLDFVRIYLAIPMTGDLARAGPGSNKYGCGV